MRIYNLDGDVLYQAWLEMAVYDIYWVEPCEVATTAREPGLLIASGLHGRRTIHKITGENASRHPGAIIAAVPHLGFRSKEYIAPDADDDRLRPRWVRFINSTAGPRPETAWLRTPGAEERRENACVHVLLFFPAVDALDRTSHTLCIDSNGKVVRYLAPNTTVADRISLADDHPAKVHPAETYTLDDDVLPVGRATTQPGDSQRSPLEAGGG